MFNKKSYRFLAHTKSSGTAYKLCRYCLNGLTSEHVLYNYQQYCSRYDVQHVTYPSDDDNILEFNDYAKQLKVPFVIYGDFETFSQRLDINDEYIEKTCEDICDNQAESSNTKILSKLEPCGYAY